MESENAPAIAPNYLAAEADRQTAARAIRITREPGKQGGYRQFRSQRLLHQRAERVVLAGFGQLGTV